ncbi:hypothetical protein INR49_029370 [Caranx melampygus]|nr:hypothetical protein INR49_029370 [Caranx melampygus]
MCNPGTHMTGQALVMCLSVKSVGRTNIRTNNTHGIKCKRQPYCDPSNQTHDTVCQKCPEGWFSMRTHGARLSETRKVVRLDVVTMES